MPGAAAVAGLAAATGFAAGFALVGAFFAGFLATFFLAAFFAGFLAAFFFAAFFAGFFAAFFAAFLAGFLAAFFAAFFAGFFAAMMISFREFTETTKRKTRLYQPGLFIGASITASLALMNAVLLRCRYPLMLCGQERSRVPKKNAGAKLPGVFSGDNAHTHSGILHGVGGTTPLEHTLRSGWVIRINDRSRVILHSVLVLLSVLYNLTAHATFALPYRLRVVHSEWFLPLIPVVSLLCLIPSSTHRRSDTR